MKDIKKILAPIDFSEYSHHVLQAAQDIAEKYSATIDVLHITEDLTPYSWISIPHVSIDVLGDEILKSAEKKMASLVETQLPATLVNKSLVIQGRFNTADQISQYAKDEAIDLIIIATHGYGGLEKALLGSVADKIIRLAKCPVLTIHPHS